MLSITFQQIEAFLAVAEHLNLTDTANSMYISQSALSKIITRLENGIGVKLFIRENRGVSLTPEGSFLYDMIKQPYKSIVKSINEAQYMHRKPKRSLRIGCPGAYDYNSDYNIVKQIITQYIAAHQDVDVSEIIYEYEPQKEALMFSEVDIIISQSFIVHSLKDISSLKIAPLGSYFAISEQHPLASHDILPLSELEDETFYQIQIGSAADSEANVRYACKIYNINPKAIKLVPNMPSLIRAIGTGRGVSICGRIDLTASDIPIKYYPVPEHPYFKKSYIMAAWRTGELSREVGEFIEMLKNIIVT